MAGMDGKRGTMCGERRRVEKSLRIGVNHADAVVRGPVGAMRWDAPLSTISKIIARLSGAVRSFFIRSSGLSIARVV